MTSPAYVTALQALSDRELIVETQRRAEHERHATALVIAALMEVDARRLYLGEGCSSLFTYCTQVLHFSEHAAYGRIEAARAARRFPLILDALAVGAITLTAVGLLAPHLTTDNHAGLLAAARHRSKREVEQLIAAVRPRPDVRSSVRKLPDPGSIPPALGPPIDTTRRENGATRLPIQITSEQSEASPLPPVGVSPAPRPTGGGRSVVTPLAPERYKVQVTISRAAHDHLLRAQGLLRHTIPNSDPASIVERALALLVEDLERKKLAAAKHPRQGAITGSRCSRRVPAAVKRDVWARDEGRCAFIGSSGRCTERGFLEFHHVVPFADGGATDVANLQLRCRAHNAYEAEEWFGPLIVREARATYSDSVRTELLPAPGTYGCA